jgi:NAD(P)H-dependent flavin oxidoreductase YrpB (nitropropane dioxygenase family)
LPAGFSTDSAFAEVFGLITGRFTRFSSLRFDASGYSVRYADAGEFDQDAMRIGLAYLWNWSSWQLDAGPYLNYSALSGEGFERRLGAALNARYPVGDSAMLLIRFLHDEVNDLEPTFEFVAGSRDRVSVGFEQQREVIELVFQHPISLIASALGPPPPWMIQMGRENGVKVAALAGTVEHARRHVEAGVDIVVAQGYEAGGHTGLVSTMVLVPEVVDAISPIPVLAAGGIGNGRQLTAALALGAQGVWTGSVWLTTEEAETHPVVKEKFLMARSTDTVRSRSLTGKPARQLRSAWTDAWEDPDSPDTLPMPLQPRLVREAQARISRTAHKSKGAAELSNYFVGQIVGSMNHVKSVRSVIQEFVQEYADTMERLEDWAEDDG